MHACTIKIIYDNGAPWLKWAKFLHVGGGGGHWRGRKADSSLYLGHGPCSLTYTLVDLTPIKMFSKL